MVVKRKGDVLAFRKGEQEGIIFPRAFFFIISDIAYIVYLTKNRNYIDSLREDSQLERNSIYTVWLCEKIPDRWKFWEKIGNRSIIFFLLSLFFFRRLSSYIAFSTTCFSSSFTLLLPSSNYSNSLAKNKSHSCN